ncbi:MAG: thiamine/thiamine pyrophosphate ABC transporter permease [Pseudomonadota bacterium]
MQSTAAAGTRPAMLAGLAAMVCIAGAVATPMLALVAIAPAMPDLSADYLGFVWSITRFTVLQAGLSTLLSVMAAVPLARALARQASFPGRQAILRLLTLPLALPALVVVLGIVEVWGRQGWVSTMLQQTGLTGPLNIYGLSGILIAHVFFNMALAARLLVAALEQIPPENWRLAAQLSFSSRHVFRHIEWPVIRSALPGIASLVFMLCIASFAVVLVLGGGPRATTLEVAIYQSLRFDFDPPRAVLLAALQLSLCAGLFALGGRMATDIAVMASVGKPARRPDQATAKLTDTLVIAAGLTFMAMPMLAIVLSGITAPFDVIVTQAVFWRALVTSLALALAAASLCLVMAWSLLAAQRTIMRRRIPSRAASALMSSMQAAGSLILVVPPVVIGAGWFVVLHRTGLANSAAPVVVAVVNALMALPFALRILRPAVVGQAQVHDRLCASLGLTGMQRWRLIDLPVLARSLTLAFAFAAALSIGDLGAAALFGSADFVTLPLLLLQKMGSYRSLEAAGIALLLAGFCLGLIWLAEKLKPEAAAQ